MDRNKASHILDDTTSGVGDCKNNTELWLVNVRSCFWMKVDAGEETFERREAEKGKRGEKIIVCFVDGFTSGQYLMS